MKLPILCLAMAVLTAGCVTIEKRALLADPPTAISLDQVFRIYGQGLSKSEWVELPVGDYTYKFSKDGDRYYLRSDPLVRIKTLYPETSRPGGIVYRRASGRFHAFAAIVGPVDVWLGGLTTVGKKGELMPFPMGVIPDEVLVQFKDQNGQSLR
jgi:hypothetical protein